MPLRQKSQAKAIFLPGAFEEGKVMQVARDLRDQTGGKATLALVYLSPDWEPFRNEVVELIQIYGHVQHVAGCSAGGMIANGHEFEEGSGMALTLMNLPNTQVTITSLHADDVKYLDNPRQWQEKTGIAPKDAAGWLILGHPSQFPYEEWLAGWNAAYPGSPCFGGMASGRSEEDDVFLMRSGSKDDSPDALLIGFSGGIWMDGVVSQGCRPIGEPATITEAQDNLIFRLATKPAYEVLQETFRSLPLEQREVAQGNILAGFALAEHVEDYKAGDFLVSNILGGDPTAGILQVSGNARVGQMFQFQLRDRESADVELRALLSRTRRRLRRKPFSSLLFSCMGRGKQLFGTPDHDASAIREAFGEDLPIHGFFSNGEIASVGDKTFLHGYSAAAALLFDL